MSTVIFRVRKGAVVFGGVLAIVVVCYGLLGRSWLDAVNLVVIAFSGVGLDENPELFSREKSLILGVTIFGALAVAYLIGGFFQMVIEGGSQRATGTEKLSRSITNMSNHVVLCGYGRYGRLLADELCSDNVSFIIVEADADRISDAQSHGYLVIKGNATDEETLLAAGVERAKTLVSGLPSDSDNVFITLTARELNSELQIIARVEHRRNQSKLLQAGANRIVMPTVVGANRMAHMITRPTTAEMLELFTVDSGKLEIEMDEIYFPADSLLVGKTISQLETNGHHGLLFVSVKQGNGEIIFNPDPDYVFAPDDTAVVMGRAADILHFQQAFVI